MWMPELAEFRDTCPAMNSMFADAIDFPIVLGAGLMVLTPLRLF
jgi:hypothetical protein